jgi:hypothetical protein
MGWTRCYLKAVQLSNEALVQSESAEQSYPTVKKQRKIKRVLNATSGPPFSWEVVIDKASTQNNIYNRITSDGEQYRAPKERGNG